MWVVHNTLYHRLLISGTYGAFRLGISPYTSWNLNILVFTIKIFNACFQIRSKLGFQIMIQASWCYWLQQDKMDTDWFRLVNIKNQIEIPSYAADKLIWKNHPGTTHAIYHIIFNKISFVTTKTRTSNNIIFWVINFSLSNRALIEENVSRTRIPGPWTG